MRARMCSASAGTPQLSQRIGEGVGELGMVCIVEQREGWSKFAEDDADQTGCASLIVQRPQAEAFVTDLELRRRTLAKIETVTNWNSEAGGSQTRPYFFR